MTAQPLVYMVGEDMDLNLKFIPATEADIDEIYIRLMEVFLFYQPYHSDPESELMRIYKRLKAHIREYTSVKYNGEKAGFYYFHEENGKMRIQDMYVLKRFRARGIGSAMLHRCIMETELPIIAEVYNADFLSMSLLKHNGFAKVEQLNSRMCIMENVFPDPYTAELYYELYS